MSLATLSDMGLVFCVSANMSHVCCLSNHVYNNALLVFYSGMILSNKEKNGKLCNPKIGHPTHVEDMSCVRQSRYAPMPP